MLLSFDADPPIQNSNLKYLFGLWRSKQRQSCALPGIGNIDPVEILQTQPSALKHIWLLDVVLPGPRFRYRLIGGALEHAQAKARTGRYVDEFEDSTIPDSLHNQLSEVVGGRFISYRIGPPRLPHSPYISQIERISLPLASDSLHIDTILNATAFEWSAGEGDAFELLAAR